MISVPFTNRLRNLATGCLLGLCLTSVYAVEERTVVIDPGHGGSKPSGTQAGKTLSSPNNATSPAGVLEKTLTLELSLEIKKQIEALAPDHPKIKLECILTRTGDSNPDFAERAETCARHAKHLSAIVSIHFNASENHRSLGTLAVIRNQKANPRYEEDRAFAMGLTGAASKGVSRFVKGSKALAPITDGHLHGGAGSNFFHQLSLRPSLAAVPKCFLEIEFMDRQDVDAQLISRRKDAFPVIARGIAEYLYTHSKKTQD